MLFRQRHYLSLIQQAGHLHCWLLKLWPVSTPFFFFFKKILVEQGISQLEQGFDDVVLG
jgi:hypothetical protein